ncbi:DNA/RNA endonuclease [Lewinellaceae bacterium SD302]|nr:DNA/RNA endonuclease [Lewinellaceae bacterium SD302]
MAKLRRNHQAKGTAASTGSLARIGILGAIIAALAWGFNSYLGDGGGGGQEPEPDRIDYAGAEFFYPTGGKGELIEHAGFALSYLEDWEQAEWTAHILTRENLEKDWNKRSNNFRPDPFVQSRTAIDDDYRGSGYDRGHLVPSADLAWNAEWADESFMFSNISPQARQFNQGIWRELEETTRDWAKKFKRLYVITGPITTQAPKGTIGRRNRVAIPVAYFKVLLDLDDPERKGIGFLIPNQVSFEPLYDYAYSIDEIEEVSGLNFFSDLMPPALEAKIEADGNIDLWPFNQRKYQTRINDWNNVSN